MKGLSAFELVLILGIRSTDPRPKVPQILAASSPRWRAPARAGPRPGDRLSPVYAHPPPTGPVIPGQLRRRAVPGRPARTTLAPFRPRDANTRRPALL